jgi:Tfp pilus assembly protein PilZ
MKTLTIFYIFNYPKDIDIKFIDEYLRIFLNCNLSSKYNIIKVLNVATNFDENKDVIENGFTTFNQLQQKIMSLDNTDPIKNSDFIFFYIGNGNILNKTNVLYKNADVLLLNNNILHKKVYYTINTNVCNVLLTDNRNKKLNKIKIFRSTLDNIFTLPEQNILEYT